MNVKVAIASLSVELLFLVPDLSLLGYPAGPRIGARICNASQGTMGPRAALAARGVSVKRRWASALT